MKMQKFKLIAVALSSAVLMACGGGGDVAGDNAEFMVSPPDWKFAVIGAAEGSCPGPGYSRIFTIIGGQPPFRIHNPQPDILQLDRTTVEGKDPRFKVTTLGGGCGEYLITVVDYHSQVATIEIELEEGDETDSESDS